MAFEDVFGNIDFSLPVRTAQADRAYFAQMLGQQIQDRQFQQKMDLERRKLDQKGDVNVEKLAENALLKRNMGIPITAQEQAAIQTMGQTQRPQIYTDPLTQQTVIRPSPWAGLTGQPSMGPQGQGANPAITTPYEEIQPRPMTLSDIERQVEGIEPAVSSATPPEIKPYRAPATLGGRGTVMEEEFKRDVDLMRAEDVIQEEAAERAEIKGVPKKEKRILESAYAWENTSKTIDEAIDMVSPFSAGVGTISAIIPATPARDLAAKLETIQADAAFGALQKMRDNSKTGGALGQVSERELALLRSSQAPLDQAQSPSQLIKALTDYRSIRTEALRRVADAFEEDYGYRPKQIDDLLKEPEKKRMRYNPQTNQLEPIE